MNTTESGQEAEAAVAEQLATEGYKIIELNWKTPYAEIDVVAQKDKVMYFVEVKYRRSLAAGDGFDYITRDKLRHMTRAAESWVNQNNWNGEYELLAAAVIGSAGQYDMDIRPLV